MTYQKYPRTYHLPNSLGRSNDDKVLPDLSCFEGKKLIATLKMDGENTTMYGDHIYARSVSSGRHESRTWAKALWSQIAHEIPKDWRLCGENLYARHSIAYEDLKSYFYMFSAWTDLNYCVSWEKTKSLADRLNLKLVDVIAEDFTIDQLDEVHDTFIKRYADKHEGYVIRNSETFPYESFSENMGKFVRENHVQTDDHWMYKEIIPNSLKNQ